MKALGLLFVLLVIGIVGLGFYQGWFRFSTNSSANNADHTASATITVDQDKIHADEEKAKEKAKEFGQKTKK
jgi:hypothetical protein